jgi:hypothetical protein
METKYLSKFQKLAEVAAGAFTLHGGRLIIELLPKEEIKIGSLVLSADHPDIRSNTSENRPVLAVVLMVGSGYTDDDGNTVPCDVQPGNVIWIPALAQKPLSNFPGLSDFTINTLAMVLENQIQMSWPSLEDYSKYRDALNS